MLKRLRRSLAFSLLRHWVGLARILPRGIGRPLFGHLGGLAYLVLGRSRRVALVNLRLIYGQTLPDKEISGLARQAFVNLGRFAYDVARLGKAAPQGLMRLVSVRGVEHLDRALARGKGVIGLSGHVGNWELLGAYLSQRGYRVNVLATRLKDDKLDDLIVSMRRQAGLEVLERSRGVKEALRCLRRGEILGVLIDQDTSVDSVIVDFLGRPAKTAVGPVKLAVRTGAAVVPMAMLATDDGGYRIEVREPVVLSGREDTVAEDVERCSRAIESFIRAEPSQWVWMHKRWKSVVRELYA
jgi:KDO2-lipid IV(A) lauroyltransferase